jgi:hypothetical protein
MHEPRSHVVQPCGDDTVLLRQQVGQLIGEGLAPGEPALVCQLGQDGHDPVRAG